MSVREGLYLSLGRDRHLGEAVVDFVGYPAPFLFVGRYQLADQVLKPALAVGYRYSAVATRMTRSAMLEVLGEDAEILARFAGREL